METIKRLEISSALAGLAGIILTVIGLFFPWGSIIYGYRAILIPLNGLQANYTSTGIYTVVALCIEVFGFFLLLAAIRKAASAILAATASFMIIQTIMWLMNIRPLPSSYSIGHIENIGPYATLIGSSLIVFAALLSLLQLRLSS